MKTKLTLLSLQKAQRKKGVEPNHRLIRQSLYGLRSTIKSIRLPKKRKLSREGLGEGDFNEDTAILVFLSDVVHVIFNIANVFDFDAETEVARHFPDMCGYCKQPSCICHTLEEKPKERLILSSRPDWVDKMSAYDIQNMLWRIYPKQKTHLGISKLALHLSEEILELLEVLDVDGEPDREQLILESIDVLEKAFDIASLLSMDLSVFLAMRFGLRKLNLRVLSPSQSSFFLAMAPA